MPKKLPRTIQYLAPVLERLSRLDVEDVDEGMETRQLLVVLKERIEGLEGSPATQRLVSDKVALDRWLQENPDHAGHFVSAFMAEADQLVSYLKTLKSADAWKPALAPRKKKARRVTMQVPEGFECWSDGPGLCMRKGSQFFTVAPIGKPSIRQMVELMTAQELGVELVAVSFGRAVGYRCVSDGRTRSFMLRVGKDEFTVTTGGADSAIIEPYLGTLSYETET